MPITKVVLVRMKPAWFDLSEDERRNIGDEIMKIFEKYGVKSIAMLKCHWSCEEWHFISIEEHRDLESMQKYQDMVMKIKFPKYADTKLILGTTATIDDMIKM